MIIKPIDRKILERVAVMRQQRDKCLVKVIIWAFVAIFFGFLSLENLFIVIKSEFRPLLILNLSTILLGGAIIMLLKYNDILKDYYPKE